MKDTDLKNSMQAKNENSGQTNRWWGIFLALNPEEPMADVPLSVIPMHSVVCGNNEKIEKLIRLSVDRLSVLGCPTVVVHERSSTDARNAVETGDNLSAKIVSSEKRPSLQAPPVEVFTLEEGRGVRMRAGVADFGPLVFARMVGATEPEKEIIRKGFAYCSNHKIPAVNLKGFLEVLKHLHDENEGDENKSTSFPDSAYHGLMDKVETAANLGAEKFLGERVFDVQDFIYFDEAGRGTVNVILLDELAQTPLLYSSFLLQMLIKLYLIFPDTGRVEKPKLAIHLPNAAPLFKDVTPELLAEIVAALKGLQQKGIGVIFGVNDFSDLPEDIYRIIGLGVGLAGGIGEPKNEELFSKEDCDLMSQLKDDEAIFRQRGAINRIQGRLRQNSKIDFEKIEATVGEIEEKSRLLDRYNLMQDERTAYQIVLSAIAEQAQNVVVPKEDFVKKVVPEIDDDEPHGVSRLLKKLLHMK